MTTSPARGHRRAIAMKMLMKKIVCLLILAYFLVSVLTACTTERYACATYAGHHTNLYAKYKVKR